LSVGDWTTDALPAIETIPIRVCRCRFSTNARAADCAASSRFGLTSVARMLPDVSIARMTLLCIDGSDTSACGRETATISAHRPTRNSNGGTCRRNRARAAPVADKCEKPASRA